MAPREDAQSPPGASRDAWQGPFFDERHQDRHDENGGRCDGRANEHAQPGRLTSVCRDELEAHGSHEAASKGEVQDQGDDGGADIQAEHPLVERLVPRESVQALDARD